MIHPELWHYWLFATTLFAALAVIFWSLVVVWQVARSRSRDRDFESRAAGGSLP
jgi:hypothetical protein